MDTTKVDHNEPHSDLREGVWTRCRDCGKEFRFVYDEYGYAQGATLLVAGCESGGIYSIRVRCPHCTWEEGIL